MLHWLSIRLVTYIPYYKSLTISCLYVVYLYQPTNLESVTLATCDLYLYVVCSSPERWLKSMTQATQEESTTWLRFWIQLLGFDAFSLFSQSARNDRKTLKSHVSTHSRAGWWSSTGSFLLHLVFKSELWTWRTTSVSGFAFKLLLGFKIRIRRNWTWRANPKGWWPLQFVADAKAVTLDLWKRFAV